MRLPVFSVVAEEGVSGQPSQSANRIQYFVLHPGEGQSRPHATRGIAEVKNRAWRSRSRAAVNPGEMIKKSNPAGDPLPDGWLGIRKNPDLPDPVVPRVGVVESVLEH